MENCVVIYSAVQIYDERELVYGFENGGIYESNSTRKLNQCTSEVWFYGSYDECLNFIKQHRNYIENATTFDSLTINEITKETVNRDRELTSFSWVDKFNSFPYDFMRTLTISKLNKVIDYDNMPNQ